MAQSAGLSQFPDLPPEVVTAFVAQSAALEAARFEASVGSWRRSSARRGPHEQAVVAEKPEGQVGQYRHAKFGPKSEKLGPAQLKLALEDLDTAIAGTQTQIAVIGDKIAASATRTAQGGPTRTAQGVGFAR